MSIKQSIKRLLTRQLQHFDSTDLDLWPLWRRAAVIFVSWAAPAFCFVLFSHYMRPNVIYYQEAIREAIGPHLWNVIGSFAMFVWGLALMFPRAPGLVRIAGNLLISTYSIGALTWGILAGQWWVGMNSPQFAWWQTGLLGVTGTLLLGVLLALNLILWAMWALISPERPQAEAFSSNFGQLSKYWRAAILLATTGLIAVLFWNAV